MNIIKSLIYFYLISLNFIEWNIAYCMEEKENSYDIGARYYEGIGVEPDKTEAVKWFRRAAEEENHVTAQFRLAICYELGEGVAQDKAELAKWLQKAAEQGHIIAQFRTGVCYEKGEGVIQDKTEALKWFQKAADQGNKPAQQRVIKLKSELFGQSSTADQLNSSHTPNANISKIQASPTNKNNADKGNSINNTNPITSQNQRKPLRQNNQKQNNQNTLSPEEFKKAEEAARKAMDELIAAEEAELRKREQSRRGNFKKVKGKGNEEIKKEEKKELVSTKQITSVKKATEKSSGNKPGQISSTKISAVDKVPTITPSLQTQKQDNASKRKKKGQESNTTQTTQAVNDNHMLSSPETQKEATDTVEREREKNEEKKKKQAPTKQITSLKEAPEKQSDDKLGQVSSTKNSAVDKVPTITPSPQTQKQDNVPKGKQKGQGSTTAQTTLVVNNNPILALPDTQKEVTNTVGKEGKKKEEGTNESVQTTQVMDLKKTTEKPTGNKFAQTSNTKVSAVDKVPTITRFSQTQKQVNVSQHKQDGQLGNTGQTTKAIDNKHILAFPETQSEATNTVGKEGDEKEEGIRGPVQSAQVTDLKKATDKPSDDKVDKVSNTKIPVIEKAPTVTHSPQTQKQGNASRHNQKDQSSNTTQTTQAVKDNLISVSPVKQSEATNTVEKEGEKGRSAPTKKKMGLKEALEKPSDDKLGKADNTKISDVDKVSTIIPSLETKKQDNDSLMKQNDLLGITSQTTQVVHNNPILSSPETQKEATNIIEEKEDKKEEEKGGTAPTKQITSLKKAQEKPSGNKPAQVSSAKISAVEKLPTITNSPQIQKQDNDSNGKQKGQSDNTTQATKAVNNEHVLASPETQKEATNTVEKEKSKKEEAKKELAPTKQIRRLKEAQEKPSGDNFGKDVNTKISAVDKLPTITNSPQMQKQDNDSNGKQKDQQGSTAQPTQVVNKNRILTYPEKQSKPINNVWKKKATSINSTADTNDGEKNAVIDTNQLLQADSQPESISDPQPKSHKQKNPKALWSDVKGILKKKKPEYKDEARKETKAENNSVPISSPIFYPPIAYPTEHTNGGAGIPYFSGQIRYIQVPVPFPVPIKIPVYIPVPSSFAHVSGNMSQPWVPHTQINYEDGKKIVTQWNDDGKGSTHVYHPDSDNVELEYSYLDTRLRHLKSILKTHGSQIDDEYEDNMADSTSSHIIYHGGDAAKQKNEELKKKIGYLEKLIQEKSLGSSK